MRRVPRFHRLAAGALVAGLAFAAAAPAMPPPPPPSAMLAEVFTWSEFVKFWKKQGGRTTGVFGVVTLVGLAAFLIILSKGRKL